ncbi:LytTR family DNA-binding domain-containing protein [Enterococcus hermanniensis]|uniref:HTH LytTR-type domain-containing protein n=1 Tax=Enterococcus hermanniensis TaxID=249189 RepID=A0A1L8TPK0_9ENTE|nr:LytTR family DNA-binding domain-containing protein [Enterococcus hermanniensis]OJG46207.1 hypothetical protein RV04_GL001373 [Enterococcus hermanniensis]
MDIQFIKNEELNEDEIKVMIQSLHYDDKVNYLKKYLEEFSYNPVKILIDTKGRTEKFKVKTIVYIEVLGDYSTFHLLNNQFSVRKSLAQLIDLLDSNQLIQVSRNTLLNIESIVHIESSFSGNMKAVLATGDTIIVSRKYWKKLKEVLYD